MIFFEAMSKLFSVPNYIVPQIWTSTRYELLLNLKLKLKTRVFLVSPDGYQQKSRIKHIAEDIAGGNRTLAFEWCSSYWCRASEPALSSSGTQSVPPTASKGGWPARPRPRRCCQLLSHRTARTLIHTLAHQLYSTAQNGTERKKKKKSESD